ncbi:MAG TPA: hypothetical protein VGH87_29455, partial [Polyangiaceae bacterium]
MRRPSTAKVIRLSIRAGIVAAFVAAALAMRSHPAVAGVLLTLASAMLAMQVYFAWRLEALARAVEQRDLEAIERIAETSVAYRYQALVLVGLLGSVARARS